MSKEGTPDVIPAVVTDAAGNETPVLLDNGTKKKETDANAASIATALTLGLGITGRYPFWGRRSTKVCASCGEAIVQGQGYRTKGGVVTHGKCPGQS